MGGDGEIPGDDDMPGVIDGLVVSLTIGGDVGDDPGAIAFPGEGEEPEFVVSFPEHADTAKNVTAAIAVIFICQPFC